MSFRFTNRIQNTPKSFIREILKVTEAVATAFRVSGASAQEAENGVIQFAQALGAGALAWIANLAADRGRPLEAGQVVITGSVIPTLPIAPGETFRFELDGIGSVEMSATA